jgi:hypothetical protein
VRRKAGFIVVGAQWFGITVFHRRRQMLEKLPNDHQVVEVCVNNREWLQATYQNGEFVDVYGVPLDLQTISNWRPDAKAPTKKLN